LIPIVLRAGFAEELVALAPDLILCSGNAAVTPLLQVTRTVPVVFAVVADPVGSGYAMVEDRRDNSPTVSRHYCQVPFNDNLPLGS
jgi:ABC-type uncharacterized transport system substrate-binding protein